MRAECEADVLGLHVEIEAVVAAIAADSTRLHAAEGRRQVTVVLGIHPDYPGIEVVRHAQRAPAIVGPYIRREAIRGLVRDTQRLSLVFECNGSQYRTEDLLSRHTHIVGGVCKERRLDVEARLECFDTLSSHTNLRAVLARDVEVAHHLVEMACMDQRP